MDIDTQALWRKVIAAWNRGPVEHVTIYGHYAYTHTKERGPEFIPYKGEARA